MLSMPPATTISALSALSMSCANIIARIPEPHIFDSVTAPADCGRPAPSAAWRAGAWPWPAIRQLPISTSSDGVAGDAGALDRGLDRDAAELVRGERAEIAEQAADRRARGGNDDDGIGHGGLL